MSNQEVKQKMRSVVLLPGVVILVLLASPAANACSCGGGGAPCESFGTASAVFAGTVIAVRDNPPPKADRKEADWLPRLVYKFSIQQAYSGVAGTEVEVNTGGGGGDCGYQFKVGERYLVYAQLYKDKLTTSICTRTQLFSRATEDLAFLGTLLSAGPGVTIHGAITRPPGAPDEPLSPDISVVIEGESQRKEVRPDSEGKYSVSGLPAGKYKMTLNLPDALKTWRNESEVTVTDRGCAAVDWYITDNGRVNGRVLNADGEPVARILVGLVKPGSNPKENQEKLDRTDDEGNFKFSGVPRGRYLLAVNHTRFPELRDPTKSYPPSFYPGVVDETHAQAITLGPGEKVNDLVVRIPSKRPPSIVKIKVVWSDGTPVPKANITIADVTQAESSNGYGERVDEQGEHTIEGYIGEKLIFDARTDNPSELVNGRWQPLERSERVRVTLERPIETVRIVITKINR
jgi:carboxypeptidase family protein